MSRAPTPRRSRVGRARLLLIGLTLIGAFFLTRPNITLDGISYFAYLRSAVQDGDLDLLNEFTRLGVSRQDFNLTPEGHVRNVFALGSALLWWPFYLAGQSHALLLRRMTGLDTDAGYSRLHVLYVSLGTIALGLAALLLAGRMAARLIAPGPALLATLAVWFGGPFFYYQYFKGDYAHIPSALGVTLFVLVWESGFGRRTGRQGLLLGFLGGLTASIRWQEALLFVLPVAEEFRAGAHRIGLALARKESGLRLGPFVIRGTPAGGVDEPAPPDPMRSRLAWYALLLAGALLGAAPQLIYWRATLGQWLTIPQGSGFLVWNRPEVARTLFSPWHGLFAWHPLLLLGVVGLVGLARRRPRLALPLLLLFALETGVNSIAWDWEAGVSFGGRRFVSLTLLFLLGLAWLYRRLGRNWSLVLSGLATLANLLLLHEFNSGSISRRWYVSFGEILRQHAHFLTRLPQVAGTLLADNLAHQWPGAAWGVLGPALLVTLAAAALLLAALRRRAVRGLLVAVVLVAEGVFIGATLRSHPAPVSALPDGRFLRLDYRWYENGHYQLDPFRPDSPGRRHFLGLAGRRLRLGAIDFQIEDPLARPLHNGSALTTCHLDNWRAELPLPPVPTRALWLAIDGGVLLERHDKPAGRLTLRYATGAADSLVLIAGRDVWDYWETPPRDRLLWQGDGPADLTWFRVAVDTTRIPAGLGLAPPDRARQDPGSGITLFAVTQEPAAGGANPLSLAALANTDFMQDPFRPRFALNHFPELNPGRYEWGGIPFTIMDAEDSTARGTVITTAYQRGMRLKLPLAPEATRSIHLLLDGAGIRDLPGLHVGDILVNYDRGRPERVPVIAGRNIWDYWETPPPERLAWRGTESQSLGALDIPVDPARTPRSLELRGTNALGNHGIVAGFAVFAITQERSAPRP